MNNSEVRRVRLDEHLIYSSYELKYINVTLYLR